MVIFRPFRVPVARDPREVMIQEGGTPGLLEKQRISMNFTKDFTQDFTKDFTKDFTIIG